MRAGQARTHVDLPLAFSLVDLATDPEDDPLYFRVLSSQNGTATLASDGQSVTFVPEPGFSGQASFQIQADDGYSVSASATVTVDVSAAPLVNLTIQPRAALVEPGTSLKLTVVGDFADQAGVVLPASYLTFTTTDTSVATIAVVGQVNALATGSTALVVSRQDIQAATVLNVGNTSDPTLPQTFTGLNVFPRSCALASGSGTRQLLVNLNGQQDLPPAAIGTRYFASNSRLLAVSDDGLVTALEPGSATITVISRGQELLIPVRVETPRTGPAVVGSAGGMIQGNDGSLVAIAPGALAENTTVTIAPLTQADLPYGIPEPFQFAGAFRLNVGDGALSQQAQLTVPVTAATPAGGRVYFFRAGTVPGETGLQRPAWLQMETGVVGANGMAQTTSPPWPGIQEGGVFLIAHANPSQVADIAGELNFTRRIGESGLTSVMITTTLSAIPPAGGFPTPVITGVLYTTLPVALGVLTFNFVVPKVGSIELVQIDALQLPRITSVGVQIDPGSVARFAATIINDTPSPRDVSLAPRIDAARLSFAPVPGGGPDRVQPTVVLTGQRFTWAKDNPPNGDPLGTEAQDLTVVFEPGGTEQVDAAGNPVVSGALATRVPGQALSLNPQGELLVPVPQQATLGLSKISLIRPHRDSLKKVVEVYSNGVQLAASDRNYVFGSVGINQIFAVDASALRFDPSDGTDQPNPTFNNLVARMPVGRFAHDNDPTNDTVLSPRAVAFTPDGTRAYVTLLTGKGVAVIDAQALQQIDVRPDAVSIPETAGINHIVMTQDDAMPFWIAVDPLGQYAYVSDYQYERVYVIDINPDSPDYHQHVDTIPLNVGDARGFGLRQLAINSDGTRLYIAAPGTNVYGHLRGPTGIRGKVIVVNIDPEARPARPNDFNPLKWRQQIGTIATSTETFGITATANPRVMTFTNRQDDFQGFGIIEEDPSGVRWQVRHYLNLSLGLPFDTFDVNDAASIAISPFGYAFVTGFNRPIPPGVPSRDPYVRPFLPAGGNIGIIELPVGFPFNLDGEPKLVGATRPIPWSFPDNLVLSADGRILYAAYYGTHAVFAFDVLEMIEAVQDNPILAQQIPIDELNPDIDLKADYRRDTFFRLFPIFHIPNHDPEKGIINPRAPIGTGFLPQGLAAQTQFLRLISPKGTTEEDLTPTLTWDVSGEHGVVSKLYVSVFPGGKGLFPSDSGVQDLNPNRIVNGEELRGETTFTLPDTRRLTAGQTYYWGVEATAGDGRINRRWTSFKTASVKARPEHPFTSVTIVTPGFPLDPFTLTLATPPARYSDPDPAFRSLNLPPWYTAQESVQGGFAHNDPKAPWEGIGEGWFFSMLGGGANLRPQNQGVAPVTYDNTNYDDYDQRKPCEPPVPSIFNGDFESGTLRLQGDQRRFPNQTWTLPGWDYHNGGTIPSLAVQSLVEDPEKSGNHVMRLDTTNSQIVHNRLVVPRHVGHLEFDLKSLSPDAEGTIKITLVHASPSQANQQLMDPIILSLSDLPTKGYRHFEFDVDTPINVAGVLSFQLLGIGPDAGVLLDNVAFRDGVQITDDSGDPNDGVTFFAMPGANADTPETGPGSAANPSVGLTSFSTRAENPPPVLLPQQGHIIEIKATDEQVLFIDQIRCTRSSFMQSATIVLPNGTVEIATLNDQQDYDLITGRVFDASNPGRTTLQPGQAIIMSLTAGVPGGFYRDLPALFDNLVLEAQIIVDSHVETREDAEGNPIDPPLMISNTQMHDLFGLIDAADDDPSGRILKFANTLEGKTRTLTFFKPARMELDVQTNSGAPNRFDTAPVDGTRNTQQVVRFEANQAAPIGGTEATGTLTFRVNGNPNPIGRITLQAKATPKQTIRLSYEELGDKLIRFYNDLVSNRRSQANFRYFLNAYPTLTRNFQPFLVTLADVLQRVYGLPRDNDDLERVMHFRRSALRSA